MLRAAGKSWAASAALQRATASDFDLMDRDGGGFISLREFLGWLESTRLSLGFTGAGDAFSGIPVLLY